MAATEVRNENIAVVEREVQELSDKATRQVNQILEEASKEQAPKTFVAYRMPMAGVRYYF